MILINGWYFDFNNMTACRADNSSDKRQLNGSLISSKPSIFKKRFHTKEPYTLFFNEPEAHFNNKVDEEYREFLLTDIMDKMLEE